MRDDLRFAVVKEVEVFFMKIPDRVALGVPHDDPHRHQLDVDLEGGRFFVGSNFRRGLIGMRLRVGRSLRLRGLGSFRLRPRCDGEKATARRHRETNQARRRIVSIRIVGGSFATGQTSRRSSWNCRKPRAKSHAYVSKPRANGSFRRSGR